MARSSRKGGRTRGRPHDWEDDQALAPCPGLHLSKREQRRLECVGGDDGHRNMPDAETLGPWPTPTMVRLLAEGRAARRLINAEHHERVAELRVRIAVASQKAIQARKRTDSHDSRGGEVLLADADVGKAEASVTAAEVRLATVESAWRERVAANTALTDVRLAAYWTANLGVRDPSSRLLLEQLELPGGDHCDQVDESD